MNNRWIKKIILFLTSQSLSLFGSSLVQYAITWHITLETQSGIMMAISIICSFLPTFFVSPFAGVWADRFNRKILIIISDTMIALSTLVVAILYLLGFNPMWMLFLVSAIRGLGQSVQIPAVGAILPQFVPEDKLTKVNGINGSIQALVNLVTPMISAAMLTIAPIEIIFFIDVITAVIAVFILFFLHVPTHAKALEKQTISYYSDLEAGMKYIRTNGFIKRFFAIAALFFLLITPAAFLTPLQVSRSFGDDVWRLSAIEIVFSVGVMAGGALMASWGGFKNKIHSMALSSLVMGMSTVALGMIPIFWIYMTIMGIFGLVMPLFSTPVTVLFQEKVEEAYLGRVFGVYGMIHSVTMPIGMLIFGPLADVIKIEYLLVVSGAAILLLCMFMVGSKELIEAGKPKGER